MDIKCDFSPKLCLKDVPGGFSMFICWFLLTLWVSKLKYSDLDIQAPSPGERIWATKLDVGTL